MVNKKSANSTRRSAPESSATKKPRSRSNLIDPMMVAPVRTRRSKKEEEESFNDFLNGSNYNIDDLYDENGSLIIDEADEVLGRGSRLEARKTRKSAKAVAEKADIDLDSEKLEEELPKSKKEQKKAEKLAKKRKKQAEKKARRKTPIWAKILIVILSLIIIALGVGAYYFFNIYSAASGVLEGNPLDALLNKKELAKDEYGRTNILVFGTAEDDEGHGGAMLTDSILVLSVDQEKKIASTFSVPRDLWVNYTVAGEKSLWCTVGYKGKINATYFCAKNSYLEDGVSELEASMKGAEYFSKKIMEISGLDIQYYVAVDFRVLRDVVNILGGIDVDVHATDERGIYDICMHNLKLKKGLNKNLNGDKVLDLARARNAKGGYGLANSNFDREINQQRIINGIKNKALDLGILLDVNKVKGMLEAFGTNVKTNIVWAEMGTLIDVVTGLHGDVESIKTQQLFGTSRIGSQSVVVPAGASSESEYGLYNYNKINLYIRKELDQDTEDYVNPKSDKDTEEKKDSEKENKEDE